MNNRVKDLRQHIGATQAEFARRINLSRNFIAQIEIGSKKPSERTIADIIRVYGVDEHWLRTGEGQMCRQPKNEADELASLFADIVGKPVDDAERQLASSYAKLTRDERDELARIINDKPTAGDCARFAARPYYCI